MKVFALLILSLLVLNVSANWGDVTNSLLQSISNHTMPGCVAAVIGKNGPLYVAALGNFTYGVPPPENDGTVPPMSLTTMFDMASLTKVLMSTTAVMTFYQRGELDLDTRVSDPSLLGPSYAANGKETITVRNLMLHNSGYPPDPEPGYDSSLFPCPENQKYHPEEVFTCQKQIYASLMNQKLINPVGSKYVYSDLSMITAMYVIGHLAQKLGYVSPSELMPACSASLTQNDPEIAQCYYEAYLRKFVIGPLGLTDSGFLPSKDKWSRIAPTWVDPEYRHIQLQGQVSDGNAYALGGIAGHAGLFTTILDTIKLTSTLMWAPENSNFVNSTTFKNFTTIYNVTQSSRALGWDTNNYVMNTYRGCGNLSSNTWTHTGYTGTEICGDPERQIVTILLTNRCYPNQTKTLPDIQIARQHFNNAVKDAFDGYLKTLGTVPPDTSSIELKKKLMLK